MRVVIAPDSFKGSISAQAAAEAIALGWRAGDPTAECVLVPLADGGEGTVDALVAATAGELVHVTVDGPYGVPVAATYGLLGGPAGRAVIEMASASGLHLRTHSGQTPLTATTFGTGQLIADALDRGVTEIVLGLGGSATNDGGAGMASALGFRLLDEYDCVLEPGGAALARLATVDATGAHPRLATCRFRVACDVTNPLTGAQGAAAVYGPQKGASPAMVAELDAALTRLARVVEDDPLRSSATIPGAGAAGGLGFGAMVFLGATLEPGIQIVMSAVGLAAALEHADLLITGEGRIDGQTVNGKTPYGAMLLAASAGVPTIAFVGSAGPGSDDLLEAGMTAIFPIIAGPADLADALAAAEANLTRTAHHVARLTRGVRPLPTREGSDPSRSAGYGARARKTGQAPSKVLPITVIVGAAAGS